MLEVVQGLNKYVENKKTFICNFVNHVKCQLDLHNMYLCDEKKYNYIDFSQFQNFIEHKFDPLHIVSWNNPIAGVPNATLFYYSRMYKMIHKACKVINVCNMVI